MSRRPGHLHYEGPPEDRLSLYSLLLE